MLDEDLIYQIYNAVDEPDTWQSVLDNLAKALDSTHIFLLARNGADHQPFAFVETGFPPGYFNLYQQYYYQVDVWTQALARHSPNKCYASHQVYDDRLFEQTEIYNDFARQVDVRNSMGYFMLDDTHQIQAELGVMRGKQQGQFQEKQIRNTDGYARHIRKSLQLQKKMLDLGVKNNAYAALINSVVDAIFILDARGKILECNQQAQRLLMNAELVRESPLNTLFFVKNAYQVQFEEGRRKVSLLGDGTEFVYEAATLAEQFSVKLYPWIYPVVTPLGLSKQQALVLNIRVCYSSKALDIHELIARFSFTQAEAEIVRLICSGHKTDAIAAARAVSLNTVRTQIKSILQKAACHNKAELVGKILSFV